MLTKINAGRLGLAVAALISAAGFAAAQEIAPGRLLVKFKPGVSKENSTKLLSSVGARFQQEIPHIGVQILSLPKQANPMAAAIILAKSGDVEYAEPDRIAHRAQLQEPNDPLYAAGYQVYLKMVRAIQAWSVTRGSNGVPIAVLDSGVNILHPDFVGQVLPGWNSYDGSTNVSDSNGHGTAVAGVACAAANNGVGVASVAPGCKLVPIRIESPSGVAYYSTIASGLIWAADNGVRVCNISYSALDGNSTLHDALANVNGKGVVVVGASGNQGMYTGLANDPYLITVGATDSNAVVCGYSNYGENLDLCAFGIDYTTSMSGGYIVFSGTSCATPYVAGAAALVLSANPLLSPIQVESILKSTAWDLGDPGWDPYYGSGFINIEAAVQKAVSTVPVDSISPTITIDSPSPGATVAGTTQVWTTASDNNLLDKVSFYVDGAFAADVVSAPYTFTWDFSLSKAGLHQISAVARDTAGNSSQASISVTVPTAADTAAPQVAIKSPTAGARLGKTAKVSVSATDNIGISKVETYVDGLLVASSTVAPYDMQFSTRKVAAGSHILMCKAYDAAGNSGLSAQVSVIK